MGHRLLRAALFAASLLRGGAAGAGDATPGLPPTLRVLVATDEMPEMFSFDTSGPPGFERELLQGFCRIHGLTLEVVPVRDFDQIISMLVHGEGDIISGIVDTPARRERIAFTTEVFPLRHMAVTRAPQGPVPEAEALRALRVGVIPGSSWESVVIDAGVPAGNRQAYRDSDDLLEGLRSSEIDAVVMALIDYSLARKRDPGLVAGAFIGPTASAAFGIRKDEPTLAEALNGYLEGMRQARHHLMFKYLDEESLSLIALARRD
jgi:ABC-type amino acid transport substrate-binding protein